MEGKTSPNEVMAEDEATAVDRELLGAIRLSASEERNAKRQKPGKRIIAFPDSGAVKCAVSLPETCSMLRNAIAVKPITFTLANNSTQTSDRMLEYEIEISGDDPSKKPAKIEGAAFVIPHRNHNKRHMLCIGRQAQAANSIEIAGMQARAPNSDSQTVTWPIDTYHALSCDCATADDTGSDEPSNDERKACAIQQTQEIDAPPEEEQQKPEDGNEDARALQPHEPDEPEPRPPTQADKTQSNEAVQIGNMTIVMRGPESLPDIELAKDGQLLGNEQCPPIPREVKCAMDKIKALTPLWSADDGWDERQLNEGKARPERYSIEDVLELKALKKNHTKEQMWLLAYVFEGRCKELTDPTSRRKIRNKKGEVVTYPFGFRQGINDKEITRDCYDRERPVAPLLRDIALKQLGEEVDAGTFEKAEAGDHLVSVVRLVALPKWHVVEEGMS